MVGYYLKVSSIQHEVFFHQCDFGLGDNYDIIYYLFTNAGRLALALDLIISVLRIGSTVI